MKGIEGSCFLLINKGLLYSIRLNALGNANKIENILIDLQEHGGSLEKGADVWSRRERGKVEV